MALRFVGIDPNTGDDESATVWIEEEAEAIILQGETAEETLSTGLGAHSHGPVIRIPTRMVPILRKACDAAERAGLYRPAQGNPQDGLAFAIDPSTETIIFQGDQPERELIARIEAKAWSPGHTRGVPAHESVIRIPTGMVPILRKACDAAERAGLYRPAQGNPQDGSPSGDA